MTLLMMVSVACGSAATAGGDYDPTSDLERIVEEQAWDANGDGAVVDDSQEPERFLEYVNENLCSWAADVADEAAQDVTSRESIVSEMSELSLGNDGSWAVVSQGCVQLECPEKFDDLLAPHEDRWPCRSDDHL